MNIVVIIAEVISYILFSFLVGYVALQFVSESKKPIIIVKKAALLLSTLGIIICSFAPVLKIILYFSGDIGIYVATVSVLTDFKVGKAWMFIAFAATLLWITFYKESSKYLQAIFLLAMIVAVGSAGHVASLSYWTGLISHSIHFLLSTFWVGVLLLVGWFAKDEHNWSAFLRWFSPMAIGSFVLIIGSGLILMFKVVEPAQYVNAWSIPYGQMLLLKHISIIPVLVFAYINGFLSKRVFSSHTFDPKPWIKVESILLLFIFSFTGIMGTLPPPYEALASNDHVSFVLSIQGVSLLVMSLLFICMIVLSFYKKASAFLGLLFSMGFIASLYMGWMLNLFY